jgi:hypothetical protein
MKRKVLWLVGSALVVVFVAVLAGPVGAEEAAATGKASSDIEDRFASCGKWLNCSLESPNYTGACCRSCRDKKGQITWDCKRVSAEGKRPGAAVEGRAPKGKKTITGVVTLEGVLSADDGRMYTVVEGYRAEQMQKNIGKEVEVKGTVKEAEGKVTIDVTSYELEKAAEDERKKAEDAFASCEGWQNCNRTAPNYTGACCRQCEDKEGEKLWDCKVFSEGEYFDLAEWVVE